MANRSAWGIGLLAALGCGLACLPAWADDDADAPKAAPAENYSGQWKNARRGTNGPIRCVLQKADGGEWSAKFEGTFKGDPFKYDAKFNATKKGAGHTLKGEAKVSGEAYEWAGSLKGDTLTVNYKSATGNFGTFALKKQAERKKKK